MSFYLYSGIELCKAVADQAKGRRLALKMRQVDLAAASGVTLSTIKRFERDGRVGFEAVTAIAVALHAAKEFFEIFPVVESTSIAEVLASQNRPARIRRSSR